MHKEYFREAALEIPSGDGITLPEFNKQIHLIEIIVRELKAWQ
jgi:hypothetical protein